MSQFQPWFVCGVVLRVQPARLAAVVQALKALPNAEVPAVEERTGKVVAVLQAAEDQVLWRQVENLCEMTGVVEVALVYHQQDIEEFPDTEKSKEE